MIGKSFKPIALESLYMGCVSYSYAIFPKAVSTSAACATRKMAAQKEIRPLPTPTAKWAGRRRWVPAARPKALVDVLELNGLSDGGITRSGLEKLRALMLKAGHMDNLNLDGMRPDPIPVFRRCRDHVGGVPGTGTWSA